jgi:hypothetical protein
MKLQNNIQEGCQCTETVSCLTIFNSLFSDKKGAPNSQDNPVNFQTFCCS